MGNYEIDDLISLMKRYIKSDSKNNDGEIDEQGAPAAGGGGTGGGTGYPTVTKWESGVTRGPANQIGLTKWRDIVKVTRGKANTLL
jgi:hypothetical protein